VTRLDRMKHGSGIKGRDDRSSGIEIRIADALAKINPTDPLILAKQAARRNLNCSDSSGISLARAEASRFVYYVGCAGLLEKKFICSRIKKKARAEGNSCHA
jgi:hypothetical protein